MLLSKLKNVKLGEVNWTALVLELLVVFLGVTAGFLLNNWQSERADRELEQKYIADFIDDVSGNIDDLEESVQNDSLKLGRAVPILQSMREGPFPVDSANVLMQMMVEVHRTTFRKSTYENVINSGNLSLIEDYTLRKLLVENYLTVEDVEFVDEYLVGYFDDFVMPFLFEHFEVIGGELVDPAVRFSTRFRNISAGYYTIVQQRMRAKAELLAESRALVEELERQ